MTDWHTLDQTYIMPTVRRLPIAIDKAEGNYLYDTEGNRYLDLFTGLAVNVLGHSHPAILRALREQGERFLHISNLFLNPPAIRLAQRLVENSIPGKVYFANSGAESTEAAIKLIHKWTAKRGEGRDGIVVMKNSFHGRTLGALRLTRQPSVYQDFPQPDFPFYEVEPENIDELRRVCETHRPAAILAEPIQGAGGVVPLSDAYLQEMARLCEQHGILLCMDEIQTGMGRTGKLFAYQHYGLQPDLILFAKGVGGGLPLGGIIAGEKLMNLFQPGDHGTTFAPSPLSAALGNAVLDVLLDEGQMEKGRQTAEYLWSRLRELKEQYPTVIHHVQGKGMMIGIRTNRSAEEIAEWQKALLKEGILFNVTAKTVIRLLPPLTLTREEVDLFIERMEQYMKRTFL
ncbi:acetylornithine aminotransferase [Polycladomyces abyssicola]|uniref:Acetylornithine aminotransferase n=1 Tax=Polycladomyces abyssicola TaxID=1125966 RepID=A0A8D5UDM7_9BACL|nr:acetylornithine transaminase [Polycladomyces abyssicola]BCU80788.1 acetylornithine aminotransferase [Polycladomyces abyssicola]